MPLDDSPFERPPISEGYPLSPDEQAIVDAAVARNGHGKVPKPQTPVAIRALGYTTVAVSFMSGAWLFTFLTLLMGVNVFYTLLIVQTIVTVAALRLVRKVRRER